MTDDLNAHLDTLRKGIQDSAKDVLNGGGNLVVDRPEYKALISRLDPGNDMAVTTKGNAATVARCLKLIVSSAKAT